MAEGLIRCFVQNGWKPPVLIYVDKDCCVNSGPTRYEALFHTWSLQVRLDVWHFMRRLATGCITEAHPLYGVFMSRLSSCIFAIDLDDYNLLKKAKRVELVQKGAGRYLNVQSLQT